ncbi:MAG TPA: tetratricopeptide repeat protein [Candidatus Bathyarchaeia archaeon]|nr:tetratricopeptide repeat protein [Candidatus Bathyarchaeia archaeon]
MSAKSQPEDRRHQSSQDELLHRLDQLDGSLRDRIDQDQRLQSGVPEHQRPTDLDFILMSGLTRPTPENVLTPADFSRPISFFEEGVVDVDDSMAPLTIDSEPIADEVLGAAPIAPPVGFQGDSNIIEMPGMTPPAEVSETAVSEAQVSEAEVSEAEVSETEVFETAVSETAVSETEVFETEVSETEVSETEVFETEVSEAEVSKTEVSETEVSEAQAEPEPVADDADQEPELLQPSAIPGFEEAYEEPPATVEDLYEQPGPDEAGPQALQVPPAIPDKPEEPAIPEPADQAATSPETSFADEIAPSDDEVSLLIAQYLKSARQEAVESVAPPAPKPPAVPDLEPVPPLVSQEPLQEPLPEAEIEPEPALAAAPAFETELVPPPHEETRPPDFAETDLLLRALENQPRELPAMPAGVDEEAPEPAESAGPHPDEVEDLPVREPLTRHSPRRSRRSRSRARRRRIRLALMSVAIAVTAATVTGAYLWIRPAFSTPEARFASAEQLAAAGSFSQAAAAFEAFASAYPQHPSRSSAEFLAAHFACMAPARDFDEEQAVNQRALVLFEKFLRDNPTHVKAPRAWTMLAQLHYKLGRYQEAVNILRDPVLRLRDPESALPGLRTLARSYVRLGEHESAVSAYQQAAAFAGNYAPDADYDELGDLFKLRADRADDPGEVQKLRQTAVENWNHAIRVPGIDPASKAKIQDKIKWLESQLGEPQQPPATTETGAVATGPAEPAPAPAADTVPPAPAVDPAAEARFLGGGPGMDSVP